MGAKIRGLRSLFLLLFILSLSAACGGGDSFGNNNNGVGDDDEVAGESLEGGTITSVTFDTATNSAVINFSNISATERYVLAIYNYNSEGSTEAYQVGNLNAGTNIAALLTSPQALTNDVTEDFHQQLREMEADLDEAAYLGGEGSSGSLKFATTDPEVGSTRTLKVLTSFSSGSQYANVTAALRYKSSDFLVYVDARDDGAISDSELQSLMDPFQGVVSSERTIFGGNESDVDNNGRFVIFLTREVNKLGGSAGGIITGFFYAVDLFSTSTYPQSNEMEIFYTYIPDPSGQHGTAISKSFSLSNILPSVVPHEFQHMINFNMHFFENNGPAEKSFLNEALSHLAEDIYSLNTSNYMEETGIENPARVSGYLDQIDTLCFSCGSSLYQRGGSYLFIRYLYEQAEKGNLSGVSSGQAFIQNL